MKADSEPPKAKLYLLLLAIQVAGTITFICRELPEFNQMLVHPGNSRRAIPCPISRQLAFSSDANAFWHRQYHVPIPFRRPNIFISNVILFLGRLSFIFGGTLFSVTIFRHLPEFGRDADIALVLWRGAILIACLFALFCTSRELERLGRAFDG